MKGFKDSTKTQYDCGTGFAKGGRTKGAAKIATVMREFKDGTLHSGSKKGPKVTSPKQAKAIAMSEARKAGAKNMQRWKRLWTGAIESRPAKWKRLRLCARWKLCARKGASQCLAPACAPSLSVRIKLPRYA